MLPLRDEEQLRSKFAAIGARARLVPEASLRGRERSFVIDVTRDSDGEIFELRLDGQTPVELSVLALAPQDRHLVLMAREPDRKRKLLCGHDERHWFVAEIPAAAGVTTVDQAKDALKPQLVRAAEGRAALKRSVRHRRRNAAFKRQGEWFFVPEPRLVVPAGQILRQEPIRRGRGSPHRVEELFRRAGVTVYVGPGYPNGLTEPQYRRLLEKRPAARRWRWQVMRRDPQTFARGRVAHRDHKTIRLRGWHRVLLSTETFDGTVAFLD